jgi:hypothetical protein
LIERQKRIRVRRGEVLYPLLEPRRVGHQVAHGDRLPVTRRNREIEIVVDVGVEIDPSTLDQLHHGNPGEELAGRAGAEQGALRIDRLALRDISIAPAAR